ncbi:PilZ domain-containing protein [Sphingomicrobium sediminis]|uniref:PilZ domain-containing protein n=1 Tax=Sphingomicrobium sediminis TaxID=2950949 RepID=A0A9X2J3S0_9SPHN|nr:PilZ domain-containing protein [Sphingomicrobium sediminis]MCM8556482.1 PilZ domain-containing protein [Sphingomicrobium sediminis]
MNDEGMKSFRERLRLAPEGTRDAGPLLATKKSAAERAAREDDLTSVSIPRHEQRWTNMREDERHRLKAEDAVLVTHDDERRIVKLINLSGGGAMVETDYEPEFLEPVLLDLGDGGEIEAAVRWVRDGRIGMEFAKETQIGCDAVTRDNILLETIRKSFPTANIDGAVPSHSPFAKKDGDEGESDTKKRERRHPLIWSGEIHWDHDTHPVRLRNISEHGALVEGNGYFPQGVELLLDLGEAGTVFATVSWSRGGQTGLHFKDPFNVSALAEAKPSLTTDWQTPDYLKAHNERARRDDSTSPWAKHWHEPTVDTLREELEGFLKY